MSRLSLTFSAAADLPAIQAALSPTIKTSYDPDDHAVPRLRTAFNKAVNDGCVACLRDEHGTVKGMTAAYRVQTVAGQAGHDHVNFGTSLSLMPGYGSASIIIAALTLREWLHAPLAAGISAGIVPDNLASIKTYQRTLAWEQITDAADIGKISAPIWRTLPDPSDPSGNTPMQQAPSALSVVNWYRVTDTTITRQAQVLLDAKIKGGLTSSKTGHFIPVDFSALEAAGLTTPRLQAIANGETTRTKILKITP